HARTSKRSLAGGGSHGDTDFQNNEDIDFSSDVLILSGRTPVLEVVLGIGANGEIAEAINTSIHDTDNAAKTSGVINAGEIFVNDITNPGAGDVVFRASDSIAGGNGTWEFRDSLPQVRITNASNKDLKVNNINVISERQPVVWLDPSTGSRTLTFLIEQDVTPSLVDIQNLGTGDVIINGTIENPI